GDEDHLVGTGGDGQPVGLGAVVGERRGGRRDRGDLVAEVHPAQYRDIQRYRADPARHRATADPVYGRRRLVVLRLRAVPVHVQVVVDERGGTGTLVEDVVTGQEQPATTVQVRLELPLERGDRAGEGGPGEPHHVLVRAQEVLRQCLVGGEVP